MRLIHITCQFWIDGTNSLRIRQFQRHARLEHVHVLREKSLRIGLIQRPKHLIQICSGDRIRESDSRERITWFDKHSASRRAFVGTRQYKKARLDLCRTTWRRHLKQHINDLFVCQLI
jgi:hypothetical protein